MAQNIKTVQGITLANTKTIQGIAIANIKTIQGIDNTSGGGPNAFSDDFTRADSDNLGANWTEAAGDADIFSNTYRLSTGSFGVVASIYNTTTGSLTQYIKMTLGTEAQYPWFVMRYTNSSSPFYTFQMDG